MAIIDLGRFGRYEIHRKPRAWEQPRPTQTERPSYLSPTDAFRYDRSSRVRDDPPPYTVLAAESNPQFRGTRSTSRGEQRQRPQQEQRQAPRREQEPTIHELKQEGPAKATKPTCKTQQLRRFIVEIIALTLDADFDALNAALYDDESIKSTTSTLSADERSELLALSRLVAKAWRLIHAGLPVYDTDQHDLQEAIVGP
jgi:hypothetical protein